MTTTTNHTIIAFTFDRDFAFAHALVAYLNSDADYLIFDGERQTKADINFKTAALVAQGNIIDIPGDPYTYEVTAA